MCFKPPKLPKPSPTPPPITNKSTEVQTAKTKAKKPNRTQSIFAGEKKETFG